MRGVVREVLETFAKQMSERCLRIPMSVLLTITACLIVAMVPGVLNAQTIESLKYDDVVYRFSESSVIESDQQLYFSIEISLYVDTLFLARVIPLHNVKLVLLQSDGTCIEETLVGAYSARSQALRHEMLIAERGEKIPSSRKEGYAMPSLVKEIEYSSKDSDQLTIYFRLPDTHHIPWKIVIGKAERPIHEGSFKLDVPEYTKQEIARIFHSVNVMTPVLEDLYSLYKAIEGFESSNAAATEELPKDRYTDPSVLPRVSADAEKYLQGDVDFTQKLHDRVEATAEVTSVGFFGTDRGFRVTATNNSEIGTVDSVELKYRMYDPFGELVTSGTHMILEMGLGPRTSKNYTYTLRTIFGATSSTMEKVETIELDVSRIKWSNGVTTP